MARIGSFIALRSGKRWHHFDPLPCDVDIEDIAHSLAMQCRWTGHTSRPYSIASHSLHVCDLVANHLGAPEHALSALLHDAAEAYYGDVATPLKRMLPEYKTALALGEDIVAEALGIPSEMPAIVRVADMMALGDEARDLIGPVPEWVPPKASGLPCVDETWREARDRFLERHHALKSAAERKAG